MKFANKRKEEQDKQWKIISDQIKNEVTKTLSSQQNESQLIFTITKLINLKENIQTQIFCGLLHKKLVIWLDLNIQNDEYAHAKIVEAMQKINEM